MTKKETKESEVQVGEEEVTLKEDIAAEAKGEEAEAPSELEELQEELEEAKALAEEYLDGWQRARAEFSNYKKRQEAERAKIRELANANLLRKLLPILDDLERAIVTLPDGLMQLSWSQGILMIERKFEAVLESEGVEPIETEERIFDPRYHEAVTHEEAEGYEEDQIIAEVQRGYVLGDRVLRPALVRVAKASPTPEQEPAEE